MDIEIGDTVKVVCNDRASIEPTDEPKVFVGQLKSLFNACDQEGDNWIYEIKNSTGQWFLYKPRLDGGQITLIEKAKR